MRSKTLVFAHIILAYASVLNALSQTFLDCQLSIDASPLSGCPDGTLFVSSTDARANFTTVRDAVSSLYAEI